MIDFLKPSLASWTYMRKWRWVSQEKAQLCALAVASRGDRIVVFQA